MVDDFLFIVIFFTSLVDNASFKVVWIYDREFLVMTNCKRVIPYVFSPLFSGLTSISLIVNVLVQIKCPRFKL